MIVLTEEQLREVVTTITEAGVFAFDVETRGVIHSFPEIMQHVEAEWKKKKPTLKTTSKDVIARSRAALEERWISKTAVEPLRNEVFWIGIATHGQSWAIPMGHKNGEVLVPEEIGDGTTVPPPGYRGVTASGKESMAKSRYYIPATYTPAPEQLTQEQVFTALAPVFMDPTIIKVGHNVKFDARSVRKYLGNVLPSPPYRDTMVMQHIVDENFLNYSLETLIGANFGGHSAYARDGKLGKVIDRVAFSKAAHYVHLDARWTWMVYQKLASKIERTDGLTAALEQDMACLYTIMDMEDAGIPVAKRQMTSLGKALDIEIGKTLTEMIDLVPANFSEFNPGSNPSKSKLLFGKKSDGGLGLKSKRKTKTGNSSVDAEALEAIKDEHPIIPLMLKWNEDMKTKSTYVDGLLPQLVDSRLHPSFHLHRVATGRLSSSDPNLQNIPRESSVRSLFVAPPGEKLLVFDYDQIELRVMCMFSHDKKMSNFFLKGIDVHTGTAAVVLQKKPEEVTPEERQMGKGVNFLMGYGGGYKKLAAQVGISPDYAKKILEAYHSQYAELTAWKRQLLLEASTNGYVTTMSGRRRRFPSLKDEGKLRQEAYLFLKANPQLQSEMDLNDAFKYLRSKMERQAINAVIQGSAADICKQAMVDTHKAFAGTGARLLVSVHDELLASCPEDKVDEMIPIMLEAMGHGRVIEGIPLQASGHAALSWYEAKGK